MSEENNVNFNITPEMLNSLLSRFQANNSNEHSNSKTDTFNSQNGSTTSSTDTLNSNDNNANFTKDNNSNENIADNFDFDTILKMKNIINTLNKKDDPRANLLYSLKPYLRESKKKKLDQYVNLLKFTDITGFFKMPKGDSNK